jgi:hypothetical protein
MSTEIEERLAILLDLHSCDPSLEGWRTLAIRLALRHEPLLAIETPVDRDDGDPGRKSTQSNFIWRRAVKSEQRNGAKSATEAAHRVRAKFPDAPSVKTLCNIASGKGKAVPMRAAYELTVEIAAEAAARRLGHVPKIDG